jgi:hypothetical protein
MDNLLEQSEVDTINNKIDLVAPIYIPEVWWRVRDMVEYGLNKMDDVMELPELYHRLACGEMLLWTVQRDDELVGVALTEVGLFATGRVCFVYLVAGQGIYDWADDLHDEVLIWAQTHGCQKIKALGRPGWKKFYKDKGWKISAYEYALPINCNLH